MAKTYTRTERQELANGGYVVYNHFVDSDTGTEGHDAEVHLPGPPPAGIPTVSAARVVVENSGDPNLLP